MPLELGLFFGAKRFGQGRQKDKVCLILDREPFRFRQFISDISGQDVQAHNDSPDDSIAVVRNWLRNNSGRRTIPGGRELSRRYQLFRSELPGICDDLRVGEDELTFNEYTNIVSEWLQAYG